MSLYPDGMNTYNPACPEYKVTQHDIDSLLTDNDEERKEFFSYIEEFEDCLSDARDALNGAIKVSNGGRTTDKLKGIQKVMIPGFQMALEKLRNSAHLDFDDKRDDIEKGDI